MKKLFESWRRYLKESAPYGGGTNVPTLAGTQGTARGMSIQPHEEDEYTEEREDSNKVVKIVLQRNGQVLLMYTRDEGCDLPGGHLKRGEQPAAGIHREVREETQIDMDMSSIVELPIETSYENTRFWGGKYLKDVVVKSSEHDGYAFKSLEEINDLPNGGSNGIPSHYKNAIRVYFEETQEPQG